MMSDVDENYEAKLYISETLFMYPILLNILRICVHILRYCVYAI